MSIKDTGAIWRAADGTPHEIIWMTSTHIYHALRMVIRAGKRNLALKAELEVRGFLVDRDPPRRETPAQMIWVRALIDSGQAKALSGFYRAPDQIIASIMQARTPVEQEVVALAMKYRLTR